MRLGIDAIQDVEHVGGHAARQRAGEHDRLIDGGGKRSERVSLRGVGGFRLVHFIGDAKFEEVRKKTSDEFNRCVAADSGAVSLPKGTVERLSEAWSYRRHTARPTPASRRTAPACRSHRATGVRRRKQWDGRCPG